MKPLDKLLPLLKGVKNNGQDKWTACCPAHDDRSPSLSIREIPEDGRVLLHCFSGCSAADIVYSVGLDLSDLFVYENRSRVDKPFSKTDMTRCLASDIEAVATIARLIADGYTLSAQEADYLNKASIKIADALKFIGDE